MQCTTTAKGQQRSPRLAAGLSLADGLGSAAATAREGGLVPRVHPGARWRLRARSEQPEACTQPPGRRGCPAGPCGALAEAMPAVTGAGDDGGGGRMAQTTDAFEASGARVIAELDDAPVGRPQACVDHQPETRLAGYRQLAYAVLATGIADVATLATRLSLPGALLHLDELAQGAWWHVWCEVLGMDGQMLTERVTAMLTRGTRVRLPAYTTQAEEEDQRG